MKLTKNKNYLITQDNIKYVAKYMGKSRATPTEHFLYSFNFIYKDKEVNAQIISIENVLREANGMDMILYGNKKHNDPKAE